MIFNLVNVNTKHFRLLAKALVSLIFLSVSGTAVAYFGPGAGLGMIGSLVAIVVVTLVVVLGLFIYPVRFLKKRRSQSSVTDVNSESAERR